MTIIWYLAVAAAIAVTPTISLAGEFGGTSTRGDAFFAEIGAGLADCWSVRRPHHINDIKANYSFQ